MSTTYKVLETQLYLYQSTLLSLHAFMAWTGKTLIIF